jgi:SAM-dependent methyltransferase
LSSPNYREFAYYAFGLKTGARSFLRNGFGAGFRATASSLLQPVNSYTRFPEYFFLEEAVKGRAFGSPLARGVYPRASTAEADPQAKPGAPAAVAALVRDGRGGSGCGKGNGMNREGRVPGRRLEVLDVGSPKLAGLYLASRYDLRLRATDISPLNVLPYARMWEAVRKKARGTIEFETQDGRRLTYADGTFDLAYALSVLEHIEGDGGDAAAVGEMLRVVKPGGRLVLSVPFGPKYIEQKIAGMAHSVERVRASGLFFFQRIYDKRRIESNILDVAKRGGEILRIVTVFRRDSLTAAAAHKIRGLPESIVTALGFLNPFFSRALNQHREGIVDDFQSDYGLLHSFGDIYGDAVITIAKSPAGKTAEGRGAGG